MMGWLRSTGVQGLAAAVLLHGVGLAAVFSASPPSPDARKKRPPVRIRVAKRPEPPPEIEKPEPTLSAVTPRAVNNTEPKPKPKPKPRQKQKPRPKPAPEPEKLAEPSPPPQENPKPRPETRPRKFTVSMEATVASGGVAVPASSGGTWAAGTPDGDPDGDKTLPVGQDPVQAPVQASETSVLPRLVSQPGAKEMRAAYPARARADGIEGNVSLKILVTADGRVGRVRIVRRAGHGFDQVAVDLVKRFRFRPGEKNGEPVAVWIPWTYKFRLDG